MDCRERREQVSLFVDRELDVREQIGLFQHLAGCRDCQSFLDGCLNVRDRCRAERLEAPEELNAGVLSALQPRAAELRTHSQEPSRFWHRRIRIPMPVVLACGLVVLALVLLLVMSGGPRRESPVESLLSTHSGSGQPTTVIFIYGLPEVQVSGHNPRNVNAEKIVY